MPHAYTEDQLVEQPAIGLFAELGWQVALPHPHPGPLPAGEGAAGAPPTAGVAGEPRGVSVVERGHPGFGSGYRFDRAPPHPGLRARQKG